MGDRFIGRAAFWIAFAYVGFLSAIILADYVIAWKFGNDFGVYWRTANSPVELAYRSPEWFPFPYAPTMLFWIQPLGWIPKWPAYFLFVASSLAAFIWAVRPYLSKAAIALSLITPPLVRGSFTGQVSTFLAALTIWACGTSSRVQAGAAFGVIVTIKPQLVIMAPLMFVLNRDLRALMSFGATALTVALLSLFFFGPERWPEWLASLNGFHSKVVGTRIIEIGATPFLIAERLGLNPFAFLSMGVAAGSVLVYLCRDSEPLEQAAAITLGSVMASPYALSYDFAAVVPFLALMVTRGRIFASLSIGVALQPIPLVLSTYELLRGKLRQRRSAGDSSLDAAPQ